jgi:hypothetical protein
MKPTLHQAIHIQFRPSGLMLGLLSLISIICCWILLVLPIAPSIKFVVILLVLASSAYFILRDALLMLPWSWKVLDVDSKGQLKMTNQRGQQLQPALAEHTFIHTQLIILNFRREGINLALTPAIFLFNHANTDNSRRLRVWLRWAKHSQKSHQEDLLATND